MNIEQAYKILTRQKVSKRTPLGRPIHDRALESIESTLNDEKNYGNEVIQCAGCGFIVSILLTESGCPNCGIEDLTTNVLE